MKFYSFLVAAVAWSRPAHAGLSQNCFSGESLVSMADGTFKPIVNVQVGDVVLTGTGFGKGIVTDKINNTVLEVTEQDVVVATTAMGELVGTQNHPVLLDG
jgi:hypothetical protein